MVAFTMSMIIALRSSVGGGRVRGTDAVDSGFGAVLSNVAWVVAVVAGPRSWVSSRWLEAV